MPMVKDDPGEAAGQVPLTLQSLVDEDENCLEILRQQFELQSFCVFRICDPPLTAMNQSLLLSRAIFEDSECLDREACLKLEDQGDRGCSIVLKEYEERDQLRYEPAEEVPDRLAAEAALRESRTFFLELGFLCLRHCCPDYDLSAANCYSIYDIFHYRASEEPSKASPCPAHTDPGLITLIFDDVPGLEVLDSRSEEWLPIRLADDEVVVLFNRQLEVLTEGRLRACTHRVMNTRPPRTSRTSLVFELRPNVTRHVPVTPLDEERHRRALLLVDSLSDKQGQWSCCLL